MKRKKKKILGLERLESRDVPATFGIPWVNGQQITTSFAPDGTNISGAGSNLFGHMQADGLSNAVWQGQIEKAIQAWSSQANINVGVVSDSGADLGTAGLTQGDTRFGDIRVGMRALDNSVLAITTPPGSLADTSGGDIILNSNYHFSVGGAAGTYDLYSVVIHEAGHAFGLGDNTTASSVMDGDYQGVRAGLAASDVAAIQSMYGTRQADAFEGDHGDDTLKNAANLPPTPGSKSLFAVGDIATPGDVDYYKFNTPDPKSMAGGTTLKFRTAGVSLLAADVSLVDQNGNLIASATSNGNAGVSLTLSPQLLQGKSYYVAVQATAGSSFNVGTYELSVLFTGQDGTTTVDPATLTPTQVYTQDTGKNSTPDKATNLAAIAGTTSLAHYSQFTQFGATPGVDYYKVQPPKTDAQTTNLLVTVRSMSSGLPPAAQFYTDKGQLLVAEQLSSTSSSQVYQIRNVDAKANITIGVASAGALGASKYNLQVDFVATAINVTTAGSGTLSATNSTHFHTLVINQQQVMTFNFTGTADGLSSPSTMWVQLYDKSGNTVSLWMVQTGGLSTESLLLAPGEYTFKIWATLTPTSTGVDYTLGLTTSTDPIGIALADPTLRLPTGTTSTPPPPTTTTPVTTKPPAVIPPFQFYTYDPSYYAWLITPM